MRRTVPIVVAVWLGLTLTSAADVTDLIKMTKSQDADERRNAYKDLGAAMGEAKVVLPVFLAGLKDPDRYVRRFSAQGIAKVEGADPKVVVPALGKILMSMTEEKDVMEAAAHALRKMGPAGVDPLAKLLKDSEKDLMVRTRAAESLGVMGRPDAAPAVPALLGAFTERGNMKKGEQNETGTLRLEAVNALGKLAYYKDEDVVKALESAFQEKTKDKAFKSAVGSALKMIKNRK